MTPYQRKIKLLGEMAVNAAAEVIDAQEPGVKRLVLSAEEANTGGGYMVMIYKLERPFTHEELVDLCGPDNTVDFDKLKDGPNLTLVPKDET